jgi:demethylmenaquinone methyltransferase/2-methoxy-6-polyprenyl-1,4-benzoquinol methylase
MAPSGDAVSSYVYMKVLESSPERYDRGMRWLSRGRIEALYEAIADAVAAGPGQRILDLGCGTGGLSLACARRGAQILGVDLDAGMLEVAQTKVGEAELAGSVELVELGAMELEDRFEAESFDAAVSCLMFSELLPEEQRYVLKTLAGLLRPGGRLVIADEVAEPGARGLWHRVRRAPLAALTFLLTQTGTQPVAGLGEAITAAGFIGLGLDAQAPAGVTIFSARRPEAAA